MMEKIISLLMSCVDRSKPVFEVCRIVQRMSAMHTSPAAAKALIEIDSDCREWI